jgi:hypothetical protein
VDPNHEILFEPATIDSTLALPFDRERNVPDVEPVAR